MNMGEDLRWALNTAIPDGSWLARAPRAGE